MGLSSIDRRPNKISTLTESCVLKLRVGIDDKVTVTNSCEIATCWSKSYVLDESFTDTKFFHILRFYCFSILACIVSAREKL